MSDRDPTLPPPAFSPPDLPNSARRGRARAIFLAFALGLGLAGYLMRETWWGPLEHAIDGIFTGGNPPPAAPSAKPVPVFVAVVETIDWRRSGQYPALVVADPAIAIAPEIPGRLVALAPLEGQDVAAGTLLAELDGAIYAAEIAAAEARRQLWQANVDRARRLQEKGLVPAKSLEEALSELGVALAERRLGEANLARTRLLAPFTGRLGLHEASPGDFLAAGQRIITLSRLDPIRVDFSLPENELRFLTLGLPVALTADAFPGASWSGRIEAIDPVIDPATHMVRVRARFPNADFRLKPGLFVIADLALETLPKTLVIPEQAIRPNGDRSFVYRIDAAGKAERVAVETGLREGGKVAILSGLAAGDRIVTEGQEKLRPGAPVEILTP